MTPSLTLAVCTRSRPVELGRLIESLGEQDWPQGATLLVVDNDPDGSAQAVVDAMEVLPVPIEYVREPRPGYSTVRNRALDAARSADAVCFLDDDAVVPADWIRQMHDTHLRHPTSIVRSRYAHVPTIPDGPREMIEAIDALGDLATRQPAGTSGLLLPIRVLGGLRFDEYYDRSGGEDMDLLLRLHRAGVPEVIADTLVLEQQRVAPLPLAAQLRVARWNGRVATIIRLRAGLPTGRYRTRAVADAGAALVGALPRFVLGRRQGAKGYATLAAGRWAMATAPLKAPANLGARPLV